MSDRGKRWESEPMDSCHVEERGPPEKQSIPDPPPPLKTDRSGGGGGGGGPKTTISRPSVRLLLDRRSVRDV
jgi:hypothetical protein